MNELSASAVLNAPDWTRLWATKSFWVCWCRVVRAGSELEHRRVWDLRHSYSLMVHFAIADIHSIYQLRKMRQSVGSTEHSKSGPWFVVAKFEPRGDTNKCCAKEITRRCIAPFLFLVKGKCTFAPVPCVCRMNLLIEIITSGNKRESGNPNSFWLIAKDPKTFTKTYFEFFF